MRSSSLFVFIFIISSCGRGNKPDDINAEQTTSLINSFSDYSNIAGQWSMCSELKDLKVIQYNVCPIITFNTDGTGSVKTTELETDIFTWTLSNLKLIIKSENYKSNKIFQATNYSIIFKPGLGNKELELRHKTKDISFYLTKQN